MLEVKQKSKLNTRGWVWHWCLNLKQKIKVRENKMNKTSAKKVKSEFKNEEIVMNKLGLSWAKPSLSWGFEVRV